MRGGNRAVYLLYLLNSVVQLTGEKSVAFTFSYREKELRKHVSEPALTAVAD